MTYEAPRPAAAPAGRGQGRGTRWPWGKLMDRLNLDEVEIPDLELEDPLLWPSPWRSGVPTCQPEELEQGWERLRPAGCVACAPVSSSSSAATDCRDGSARDPGGSGGGHRRPGAGGRLDSVDPYALRWLIYHPDFRRLLDMRYLSALAHASGIKSPVEPVLSMTLGPSVVSSRRCSRSISSS